MIRFTYTNAHLVYRFELWLSPIYVNRFKVGDYTLLATREKSSFTLI